MFFCIDVSPAFIIPAKVELTTHLLYTSFISTTSFTYSSSEKYIISFPINYNGDCVETRNITIHLWNDLCTFRETYFSVFQKCCNLTFCRNLVHTTDHYSPTIQLISTQSTAIVKQSTIESNFLYYVRVPYKKSIFLNKFNKYYT